MWRMRTLLRSTLRTASLPVAACVLANSLEGPSHSRESKPVQPRTEVDPLADHLFAASSEGWMLQCDDGGHLATPYPNYVPAARELREKLVLRGGPQGDVIIATYPRCGTTWMQQVVMLILAQGEKSLVERPTSLAPWVEMNHAMRRNMLAYEPPEAWRKDGLGARRVLKTHAVAGLAPWSGGASVDGIPKGAKVILVTRNPKDVALSYYHHGHDTSIYKYTGDWKHFLHELFLRGVIDFGDFWAWHGSWWRARAALPPDRLLWISYEEMQNDLPGAVRRVADFIHVPVTEEVVSAIVSGASFANMKKDWTAREQEQSGLLVKKNHIRQGRSGAWREAMSAADSDAIDAAHGARCKSQGLPADLWDLS